MTNDSRRSKMQNEKETKRKKKQNKSEVDSANASGGEKRRGETEKLRDLDVPRDTYNQKKKKQKWCDHQTDSPWFPRGLSVPPESHQKRRV